MKLVHSMWQDNAEGFEKFNNSNGSRHSEFMCGSIKTLDDEFMRHIYISQVESELGPESLRGDVEVTSTLYKIICYLLFTKWLYCHHFILWQKYQLHSFTFVCK